MKACFVSSGYKDNSSISPFIYEQGQSLEKQGIKVVHYLSSGNILNKYFNFKGINSFLDREKPDIVHAHMSYSAYLALHQKKIPVLVSFMGGDILKDPDDPFYRIYINKYINNFLLKKSAGIICKSEELKLKLGLPRKSKPVEVIPNGVPLNIFFPIDKIEARKKLKLKEKKKYILFPSNAEFKNKNFLLAQKSVSMLGDKEIELLHVSQSGREELNYYYNAADVLLFTSFTEGSPNVIKEAMATNLPIVSVKVGDTAERLKGVKNCFVTDFNEIEISLKLQDLLVKNDRSDGLDCLLSQKLDIDSVAVRIINLYKKII